MLSGRVLLFAHILLPIVVSQSAAQETQRAAESPLGPADSLGRQNSLQATFDRNLNTYNWLGRLAIDTAIAGTRIALTEQYTSNVIQVDGPPSLPRKLEANQQLVGLFLSRPVASNVSAQVLWSSLVFSDSKGVGLSNASIHSVLAGLEYSPFPSLSLVPLAGYRWDNQADVRDRGLSYTLAAKTRELNVEGTAISGSGQFHQDRLDPRLLASHFVRLGAQKSFSAFARDTMEIGYSHTRREFYALADSNIESRLDNVLSFTNLLEYEVDRSVQATLFVSVSSRGLDKNLRRFAAGVPRLAQFDTRVEEFRLETFLQTSYRSFDGRTGASLRLSYAERDEAHRTKLPENQSAGLLILYNERNRQEQTKDNFARRSSLAGTLAIPLSFSDKLFISGVASILRYDTPSDLNFEDRDELLVAATVTTGHRVTRTLDVGVSLEGNLTHVVYLLKERSANNNFNRVLRLAPRTTYRPARFFTTMNAFEVLANYTVYDFEQQAALVKSFSYRQFGFVDSSTVELSHRVALDFFCYIKLYERGQLKWSEFTERPENSFADQTFAAQLRFSPAHGATFAVGLRYFSQSRYVYDQAAKRLSTFLRSFGPTCLLFWDMGMRGHISLHGWYEDRYQPDGSVQKLANMTMGFMFTF